MEIETAIVNVIINAGLVAVLYTGMYIFFSR